jgi:hypothetical protein
MPDVRYSVHYNLPAGVPWQDIKCNSLLSELNQDWLFLVLIAKPRACREDTVR